RGRGGDAMARRYAEANFPVYEIWSWYKREVAAATDAAIAPHWWAYGVYQDGSPIAKAHRLLYRSRPDLQAAFPDPYAAGPDSFQAGMAGQAAGKAPLQRIPGTVPS